MIFLIERLKSSTSIKIYQKFHLSLKAALKPEVALADEYRRIKATMTILRIHLTVEVTVATIVIALGSGSI